MTSSYIADHENLSSLQEEQSTKRRALAALFGSKSSVLNDYNDDYNDDYDEDEEELGLFQSEGLKERRTSMQWEDISREEQDNWTKVKELLEWQCVEPDTSTNRSGSRLETLRNRISRLPRLSSFKNEKGVSLLSIAVTNETSLEVVYLLLEANKESGSLYDAQVLTLLIQKYLVPLINGKYKGYSEAEQHLMAQEWMDRDLAKPLVCYILDFSTTTENGNIRGPDGDKILLPRKVYPYLSKSITFSKELQDLVNRQSIKRSVLAVLFLDLYSYLVVIILFCLASDAYLEDVRDFQGGEIPASEIGKEDDVNYMLGIYVMVGFFFARQIIRVLSIGSAWRYLSDVWNVFAIVTETLLLLTGYLMESGTTLDDPTPGVDHNDFSDIRFLMVVTGGALFVSLILFLRNTFLPFSNFVTGTIHILKELVPFFVITVILLLAFMYMYYVQRFDEGVTCNAESLQWNVDNPTKEPRTNVCTCDAGEGDHFCSYINSMYNVFGYLAGGPDDTSDALDFICGFIVVIIFLNVVIAIVANAWDKAMTEEIHEAFWTYRLTYFYTIGVLSRSLNWMGTTITKMLRFKRTEKRIAAYLRNKSPEGIKKEDGGFKGFANRYIFVLYHMVLFFVKYGICLPLGLFTFGFFWPKDIRKFFFYNNSEIEVDEFEILQKKTESLQVSNTTLLQLQGTQSEQLAIIRSENHELLQLQGTQSEQLAILRLENRELVQQMADVSRQMANAMTLMEETCRRHDLQASKVEI